jgi:hypothetical protein
MARRALAAALLGLVFPLAAGAQSAPGTTPSSEQYAVRFEYRRFSPDLAGAVQKTVPSPVDLVDDLGMEQDDTGEYRGTIQMKPGLKIRGSYTDLEIVSPTDYVAPRTFVFGTTVFPEGAQVVSTIDGFYATGALEWDFVRGRSGYFGAFVGAKGVSVDSVVVAPQLGERETDSVTAFAPVAGIAAKVVTGRFSIEGEFGGMTLGSSGWVYEVDSMARLYLSDRMSVGVGWRRVSLEGKDDPDLLKLELSGLTYGAEISF